MIDDFTAKLTHVLKVANLSRTRLSKLAGVDKSVASRWVSGATRPSDANLDALTRGLNAALPDLKLSDWARPLEEFVRKLGGDTAMVEAGAKVAPTVVTAKIVPTTPQDLLLPDKPSIAVLPFANMSGDSDQEFFGDGIAEDILTVLSKLRWLFVISRNSSFTYKGKPVDIRQVSRELGVRYVLEGSVRRVGTRARITAQLIDAVSGAHVWAERFERDLTDIFVVQDEIVDSVISAIAPAIIDSERQRAVRKSPERLDAWEAYQRGLWHYLKFLPSEMEVARTCFDRAIALDPMFGPAYWGLAIAHMADGTQFLTVSYAEAVKRAEPLMLKALALDGTDSNARALLGSCLGLMGDKATGLREIEHVLAADVNCTEAHGALGFIHGTSERHAEGQAALRTAIRLGPRDPRRAAWSMYLAMSQYLSTDYEGAVETARKMSREFPTYPPILRWLAASLGQLGHHAEAAQALKRLLELAPSNVDVFINNRPPWMVAADHAHMIDGLSKAGWKASKGASLR